MSLGRLIVGGVAIAGAAAYHFLTPKTHDQLVESTYKELHRISDDGDSLYVDHHHYNPGTSAGNTRSLDLTDDHHPDIVVNSQGKQYIVEVETNADALNNEARSQLRDFRRSGYTRLLVVPHDDVDAAEAFVDDLNGRVEVASPKMLSAAT